MFCQADPCKMKAENLMNGKCSNRGKEGLTLLSSDYDRIIV